VISHLLCFEPIAIMFSWHRFAFAGILCGVLGKQNMNFDSALFQANLGSADVVQLTSWGDCCSGSFAPRSFCSRWLLCLESVAMRLLSDRHAADVGKLSVYLHPQFHKKRRVFSTSFQENLGSTDVPGSVFSWRADWGLMYSSKWKVHYEKNLYRRIIWDNGDSDLFRPKCWLTDWQILQICFLFVFNPVTVVFATPAFIALVLASLVCILCGRLCCHLVEHPLEVSAQVFFGILDFSAAALTTPLRSVLAVRLLLVLSHPSACAYNDVVPLLLSIVAWSDKIHLGSWCPQISCTLVFCLSAGRFPWWCVRALCMWELLWPTFSKREICFSVVEVSKKVVFAILDVSVAALNTPLRFVLVVRFFLALTSDSECACNNVVPLVLSIVAWNNKVHFGSLCPQISSTLVFYLSAGRCPWWCVRALCMCELLWPTFGKRALDSKTVMQKVQKILHKTQYANIRHQIEEMCVLNSQAVLPILEDAEEELDTLYMASDLKRWESGVIAGVRAVTPAGAATSLASANSGALPGDVYSVSVEDVSQDRVTIQSGAKPIVIDGADDVPEAVRTNINRLAKRIATNDDGACALHSVFWKARFS
jgi:hypothetical protein